MPAIIAQLVIRIGRSRLRAPPMAAASAARAGHAFTLGKGHEQDRVGHGHADGHDRAHRGLDVQRGAA